MSAPIESECIPEDELMELFEPRRPEPETFREGVERRIEKLRAEEEKADATPTPSWLRRVASMFPGDIFVGAASGSAVGKVAAAKLLPAALALPVLLLGSAFGAFAASVRSLKRSSTDAIAGDPSARWSPREPQTNQDLRRGSRLHKLAAHASWFAILIIPLLGSGAVNALLLLILCSMASLAFSMRGFASAGLLTRPEVARLSIAVLYSTFIFLYWCTLGPQGSSDPSSELGIGWSVGTVLGGIALCVPMARRTRWEGIKGLMLAAFLAVALPFGWTRSSPDSLCTQIESMQLDPGDLDYWEEAAALHRALQLVGASPPNLSVIRSQLDKAIELGRYADSLTWSPALEMGLIDTEHRAKLSEIPSVKKELDGVRTGSAPLNYLRFDQYLISLLKDEARRDPILRARLADQLEAEWPKKGDHGAPEFAWLCVRGLDEIGAHDRADALRDKAHSLLVEHWVADARFLGKRGGFTSNPETFRTSFSDDTWYAVQLMDRFGPPPQIDLRVLRAYLRSESAVKLMDVGAYLDAESRASLRVLEDRIGLPERNILQRILDERLLIASLLLVALCLTAIRLAPSPEAREGQGALP